MSDLINGAETELHRETIWVQATDQLLAAVIQGGIEAAEFAAEYLSVDDIPPTAWRRDLWTELRRRAAAGAEVSDDALMAFAHESMGAGGPGELHRLAVRIKPPVLGIAVRNVLEVAVAAAVDVEKGRPKGIRAARLRALADRLEVAQQAPANDARGPEFVAISGVVEEPVEWIWRYRVPAGALTILAGNEGVGKSTLGLELVARITRGQLGDLPGQTDAERGYEASHAFVMSTEDHVATTIRPRLRVAGADLERVFVPNEDSGADLTLPSQIGFLRAWAEKMRPRLILLDPLTTCLDAGIDSHKDQDVRRALRPLYQLAAEIGAAIVGVVHLKKGAGTEGPATHRVMGSVGITAAARSVLIVGRDPEDPERSPVRFVQLAKSNLGPPALPVEVALARSSPDDDHAAIGWRGEVERDVASLNGSADGARLAAAREWLREVLRDGQLSSVELFERADVAGHAERTVDRARASMSDVVVTQRGRQWWWELAPEASD